MSRVCTYGTCFALALLLVMPSPSWAQAERRPIGDFIAAQNVFPPSIIGWSDPANGNWLAFDEFGTLAKSWGLDLGTTFEGLVMVRPLADGRAHVSVVLKTRNGLCFGWNGPFSPANVVFGYLLPDILDGATPALGDGVTKLEFMMPSPDAHLPDFNTELGESDDYPLLSMAGIVNCDGELRAASGYPDGTPGMAHTTQTGLFTTGVPDGCPPEKDADCFPAERVFFQPVGRK